MPDIKTLAELNAANSERAKVDRHLAFTTYPELIFPILLRPCTVRMLIVTDGGGSFTDQDFGLTELLSVLSVSPGPYVRFAVTKAHRSAGGFLTANADIVGFRFDTTDLSQFDQIWMIAVSRGGLQPITDAELKAISQFMDSVGGVFATGDHEDLGFDMCGRVPRVRSMRKWHWPNPGPNGEPVAPSGTDASRLDANQLGHDAILTFDDQSDDVPQETMPVMYTAGSPYLFRRTVYPHPLLCGPHGVIRYLPDHPHEGECYVPNDLSKTFTFAGHTITEYPILSGSTRLAPQLVARNRSGTGITDQGKASVSPRTFGAIGAYDGHQVSVGRVVVQSTWHHLFNINLKGKPGNADPVKQQGFHASAAGEAKYEEIKTYFRNIGVWLARPATHSCMRWRASWATRWDSRIFMDLRPARDLATIDLTELLRIGVVARDVLNRYASQCQSFIWILDWLKQVEVRLPLDIVHPWPPRPDPPPPPDPFILYYTQAFVDASLGALIYMIAAKFPEATDDARKAADTQIDRELMAEAAKLAET
jgi:hypothetical protein